MAWRIGFRGSIAAVAAALSLVTLGVAFAIVSASVNRSQERQFDQALLEVAEAEAIELSLHPGEAIVISDRPGPAANDVGPLPLFGALYAADGGVVNATTTFEGAPPAAGVLAQADRQPFDFDWRGQHMRGAIVALSGGHARLLVAATRNDLDGDAAFLKRAMVMIFGVAVAWTVVLAFGIATRITRTHRNIVATAQRVVRGDLSARVGSADRSGEMAGLARNIDEMIERLALLLKGQQQFIAHAAHELRSPLATLYGELSNAVRRTREAREYRDAIDHALRSTRRLNHLADDLLALARLGAKAPQENDATTISEVIAEALQQAGPDASARGIAVSVAGEQTPIQGRRNDLVRMFRNLIENAVRHSPDGAAIAIHSSCADGHVIVEVSDEGPGVAPEDRGEIFSPFFRRPAKPNGSSGAGLGLTIARDVARLHGGDLTLAESPGARGATFVVRLPREGRAPDPTI
jgi:two-component system heavy metal sensor histidine kinase CusS